MDSSRKWWLLSLVGAGALLTYLLAPVLTPFLSAGLLAYLGNGMVNRIVSWRFTRTSAVMLVFALMILLAGLSLLFLIPLIERQLVTFIGNWPKYVDWFQHTALPWMQGYLSGSDYSLDLSALKQLFQEHWRQVSTGAVGILTSISHSGITLLSWLVNLILIPVITIYLLLDWERLIVSIRELLPRPVQPLAIRIARDCDEVLGTFLRGQLIVMLALSVIYSFGLWLTGLDLAMLIGLGAGLVSFVPYLGLILGVSAAGIAALVQFHDLAHLLMVVGVFGIAQILEGLVLTPLLIGERLGLHPVSVIFAVMAGGQLFGLVGVLLAIPMAAVVVVLLRHAHERYLDSELYSPGED